jgi:hypothetical protein
MSSGFSPAIGSSNIGKLDLGDIPRITKLSISESRILGKNRRPTIGKVMRRKTQDPSPYTPNWQTK